MDIPAEKFYPWAFPRGIGQSDLDYKLQRILSMARCITHYRVKAAYEDTYEGSMLRKTALNNTLKEQFGEFFPELMED